MGRSLVGRESELDALALFLDDVPADPSAFLLEGEAGIGKTALWQEGVARATARGSFRLLTCQPAEPEATLSFAALGDLLETVLDEVLAELPVPQRRALETALLLSENEGPDIDRRAVSLAVLGSIRALSEARPLIIAVDDLQWMDRPTARALGFALRRVEGRPVGVLGTLRSSKGGTEPLGLDRALPPERTRRLRIGPLSVGAIHHLVRTRLGTSLARPILVRLHAASGGNPFFALELARGLVKNHEPVPVGEPLPVPQNLQDLLKGRLRRLSRAGRSVLLAAAAASRPTIAVVTEAVGSEEQALSGLSEGRDAGVVDVVDGRVRFTHPLLASALYQDASLKDRSQVHSGLAIAATDAEERARHLALATDVPDEETAGALDRAARAANARGAPDAAAELTELAIRRTPSKDLEAVERRALQAADFLMASGDSRRARSLLEERVDSAPSGPRRAAFLRRLGDIVHDREAAKDLLTEALDHARQDRVLASSIASRLSVACFHLGDMSAAVRHAEWAVKAAQAVGDPDLLGRALTDLICALGPRGPSIPPPIVRAALDLDTSIRGLSAYETPSLWVGVVHMWRGNLDSARPLIEVALDRATRTGDQNSRQGILRELAELECRAGEFLQAARHATEAFDLAEQLELDRVAAESSDVVAYADAYLGNVAAARRVSSEGLAAAERFHNRTWQIEHRAVLGFVELSLGNPAPAAQHLLQAERLARESGVGEPGMFRFHPDLIEALVPLGDLHHARQLLDELEARAAEPDHPWAAAMAERGRALIDAAEGDLEGATAGIERALAAHEVLAQPFELGRTLLVAGSIHRRSKRKAMARKSLQRAREIFERVRTPLWAEKAKTERDRLGLRPPEPTGLTPTEERIARMAASGHTNQEIGDSLFISIRTVESNLTRVYRKLGVRSRTELAANLAADSKPG